MIQLNNIAIQYGERYLFKHTSLAIRDKERIGLIGKNGAGKSTLLKLLSADFEPHEGNISMPKDYTTGFLRQDLPHDSKHTLIEEIESCFSELKAFQKEYVKLQNDLETRTDYESNSYMELIDRYTKVQSRLLLLEGDNLNKKIEQVLKGLGFKRNEFDMPVSTFSGGWRMRIELAKLLLQEPDLLLLDEPTNHLDIHSIIWLEDFLQKYSGSVIIVSHDKLFMKNLVNRIWEVELGKVNDYKAGYEKYLILKKDRIEKSISAYKNQQKEIEQTKRNIEKFRAKASKAKFAQTLIKRLEKTEIIEVEQEDSAAMRFSFPEGKRAGNVTFKLKNVNKSFGEKKVLRNISLELERGEKIAFVGKNGMGKTTLTRIIAGELESDSGSVEEGHNLQMNYFAQLQSGTLDEELTVFQTIDNVAVGEMRTKVRKLLGAFLFSGEDVDKKVKVLSGGEKSRLALAKLLLAPSNFLLLDEPTNHLDIASKTILKQAIQKFGGAVVVVSHDRDFLEGLTDRVIEFTENGLKEYLGDINYFLEKNKFENLRSFELDHTKKVKVPEKQQSDQKLSYEQRKRKSKEERKLKKAIETAEKKIERLESEMKELTAFLQASYDEEKASRYHQLEQELEKETENWMKLQEREGS